MRPAWLARILHQGPRMVAKAARIPERKTERRFASKLAPTGIYRSPGLIGAAIAQGRAGAAKHKDVRERPWPRTFQSAGPHSRFAGKLALSVDCGETGPEDRRDAKVRGLEL